jgi:hypothetical protein
MIARLGRHVRRWLHGLAIALRNRAETAASRLVSVEEEKIGELEKKVRSGTGKTERTDGPPDHWVRLVKRHAPELLHPALPYAAPHATSQVCENHAAMDSFRERDIHDSEVDNEAWENAGGRTDRFFSLKSPRRSGESDALTTSGDKRSGSGFSQVSSFAEKTQKHFRNGGERPGSPSNQPGFVRIHQAPPLSSETEKNGRMPPLTLDRKDETAHSRTILAKQQKTETLHAQISFAAVSLPDVDHFENRRIRKTHEKEFQSDTRENFRSERRTGGHTVQSDLQASGSRKSSLTDARIPVFREVKRQTAYEKNPFPDGPLNSPAISPVAVTQNVTSQINKSENEYRHPGQGRMNNGQHWFHPFEKKEVVKDKRSRPAELQWPGLPEEIGFEDVAEAHLSAVWPSLPEERLISKGSVLQQMETCLSETELRAIERLRRLDEEQKGMPWNVLHF